MQGVEGLADIVGEDDECDVIFGHANIIFTLQHRLGHSIGLRQLVGEIAGNPLSFHEVTVHGRTNVDIVVDGLHHHVLV